MKAGDKVYYVPHEIHALDVDPKTGLCSWHLGETKMVNEDGKLVPIVVELTGKKLVDFLAGIRKSANPTEARKKLALIKPRTLWEASVRVVNADKTADLDVFMPSGFITLNCDGVPISDLKGHHTCHSMATESKPAEKLVEKKQPA